MINTSTTSLFTKQALQSQWARAEAAAMDVFQAATKTGAKVLTVGASYGFPDPDGLQFMGPEVPQPGFHPFVTYTGHVSAHAALHTTRMQVDWLDQLARSCIPFIQSYQAVLPALQGLLSFCWLEVDIHNPHQAVLTVNGIQLDIGPMAFLDKGRHLRPAIASFGSKDDPISAHSVQEAVEMWEIARL